MTIKTKLSDLSIVLFLIVCASLTNHGHSAKAQDDQIPAAAHELLQSQIVQQKACTTCHTISNQGGTVGPILNQIGNRRSSDWLTKWLKDPNAVKLGTKMPNFRFNDADIEELVGYFQRMKRVIPTDQIFAEATSPEDAGEKLFKAYDCYACHKIGDRGRIIGPDLTWVGKRKTQEWERVWLKDPPAYKPDTFMPNFHLSDREIEALSSFLHTLQGQHNDAGRQEEALFQFFLGGGAKQRGQFVFERFACWSCHGEGGHGGIKNPNAYTEEEEYIGEVPPLDEVTNLMEPDEIREIVINGAIPEKNDSDGENPPYACPEWGDSITEDELNDLIIYLESLAPPKPQFQLVE